jgi:hypothetical protein
MASVPDRPRDPGPDLPARRLSSHELEAVIRRAVELQSADGGGDDGIPEAEVMRIGQELGLEPSHVRRAIGEVRSTPPEETGVMARVFGPGSIRAGRTVRRPAAELGRFLEEYMTRVECMQAHRRFPDRTRYVRDSSFVAGIERFARGFGTRDPRLELKQIDVTVARIDDDTAYVELSVDTTGDRTGYAAGAGVMGTMFSVPVATFALVTPTPDLVALAALPIFGGMLAAWRAGFRGEVNKTQEKLESFLDRLEHGEVRIPPEGGFADAVKRIKPPRR